MSIATFDKVFAKYLYWLSLPSMGLTDVLEIIIISVLVYQFIRWVQYTRAWVLFKGILVLLLFALFAAILQLNTILWLMMNSMSVLITAALIIFQPELRRALEQLGRGRIFKGISYFFNSDETEDNTGFTEKTIKEIAKAAFDMGRVRTGALIVIERYVPLAEYERTGIVVDGIVTSQLLINIFEHNTPLHDGAVIVRGNRIISATCYLPLSENRSIAKELGTRHRAAIGISEVTDSITVVVSEETGAVHLAMDGELKKYNSREEFVEDINILYNNSDKTDKSSENDTIFKKWKGKLHR